MMMKNWKDIAKDLPLNGKVQTECPENCGSGEKFSVNHSSKSYWAFCYRCGHTDVEFKGQQSLAELARMQALNEATSNIEFKVELPNDFTTDIPLIGRLWLYSAGITQPLWDKYRIGYSPKLERVILPVYKDNKLVWFQARALQKGQAPKYLQPSSDRSSVMFESLGNDDVTEVVIVEDILSAIVVGKSTKTFSLLGTKITTEQAAYLGRYDLVTTWLDSDTAGRKGAYKIRKTLSLITTVNNIITTLDPKELSDKEIRGYLTL